MGPMSAPIRQYIPELHCRLMEVGLATTLFNAVSIPAAVIWGFVTDRFDSMRTILVPAVHGSRQASARSCATEAHACGPPRALC